MIRFSLDIEKYYDELKSTGHELQGVFCIQYPIYCIHTEIVHSTPDPLDNLDRVIVDFLKVKPDFKPFEIGCIIGTSKTFVELRFEKLASDNLLSKIGTRHQLTDKGKLVFNTKTHVRHHRTSYDFYLDGITLKPLPRIFYTYYKSKLINEQHTYYYTNSFGQSKLARPFAPDLVHTPPDKELIRDLIFSIDSGQRDVFGIPNQLESIDNLSFTKMSFQLLVSVSKSKNGLLKEIIDGYAIYSLADDHTYYETLRKNAKYFEPILNDRIQNLEFKLMTYFRKDGGEDKLIPSLTSNWPEIERYNESANKCFNFSSEDLIAFLQADVPFGFGIKEIEPENIINDDDNIQINIRHKHLLKSKNRQKLLNDLARSRDYKIFNNSLEKNVFLFYIYYSTDDVIVKELLDFLQVLKKHKKLSFSDFQESHPEYTNKVRSYLLLAGEFDLLEKFDIEHHMILLN